MKISTKTLHAVRCLPARGPIETPPADRRPDRALRSPALVLFILLCLLTSASPALAATLEGRVLDPAGSPVPGAQVLVTADAETLTAVSAPDGSFRLESLEPGSYTVEVVSEEYQRWRGSVEVGAEPRPDRRLEVRLRIPEVRQEIVVTSDLPEFGGEVALTGGELTDRASVDLVESLRHQPGLAAKRGGAINLEPTVRGLQENQVGMFVDGTRTFAAGPGRMDSDVSHVSPHAVERVQVVKGPYALTWGAGALSALQVETFTPPLGRDGFEIEGTARLNYGDNASSTDGHVGVWGGGESLAFSVLHSNRQGDDYEDGDGRTVPGDYRSDETRWSLDWQAGEASILRYTGTYQGQDDLDYPGRILDATYFKTRAHALEYRWEPYAGGAAGPVNELYAQVYANRKDHRMNNDEKPTARPAPGRVPPFAIDVDLETESNTTGGRFWTRLGSPEGPWSWKLGTDFYRAEQTADRVISRRADGRVLFEDVVWPDAEIDDLGLYAQALWEGEGRQLGATVRVDRIEASAGRASDFFLANTTGALDQEHTEVSAALSGRFRVAPEVVLTAGAGRAVRAPNATELYSDRIPSTRFQLPAEFLGNPELEPEASLELDLGVEAGLGGLVLQADVFWRQIDDYITVRPDPAVPKRLPLSPPTVFRYVNGTRATFYGGELSLRQALRSWLSWRGALSWVRAEDELFDEPVLGIAPPTATLALRVDPVSSPWWIEGQATVAEEQDRVAASRFEVPTPGWTVFDLRGGWRFRDWQLRAGVENVSDESYADHLNAKNPFTGERIREPGRNVYLGFGVDF